MTASHPTTETYAEFALAYDHFNAGLFGNKLPGCVITFQRRRSAYGYFAGNSWTDAKGETITDEIAMNPDMFKDRTTEATLSTLVHEMCHLEQHHYGKPGRGRYHNKEWGRMMETVGLIPSDTGGEGGKKTGERVSHYIETGGAFEKYCNALLQDGFTVPWVALTGGAEDETRKRKRTASKTKYACPTPSCDLTVWGKPDIKVMCGECQTLLEAETPDEEENDGE